MKVLVINGSPKGNNSITIQSIHYIKNNFNDDDFEILNVGQQIKKYENIEEINKLISIINTKDLILFSYPVYSSVAPYQLHRFIELFKSSLGKNEINNIIATQLTTSKHFYDFTAHKYIEEICEDINIKTIKGFSADMDDLLCEEGRNDLLKFWSYVKFSYDNKVYQNIKKINTNNSFIYNPSLKKAEKKNNYDVLILTNCDNNDIALKNLIIDFQNSHPYSTRIININDFPFSGGCLGCLNCVTDGTCIYKDKFDIFLRENIENADSIVYAATIKDHFIGTRFKLFNDRQFCNGHRTVTMGKPVGYILNGNYSEESNLINILEGRSEVSHEFLLVFLLMKVWIMKKLRKVLYHYQKI